MRWNVKNFIGKNSFVCHLWRFPVGFFLSLKKVQEKKKQARALQEKKRAEMIENGALTGKEEEAPNILDEEHDEDNLFL